MAVPNAEVSFWNHRQHSLHMERLSQIKPTMNIKDESHVRSIDQRKKELIRQQREAKIEQDNKKLVVNMMQIVAKMGKESAQAAAPFKVQSRAEAQRRRQAQEIARQNYTLAMRIINQKPSFDQKKLESDFKKHEQIVKSRTLHTKRALEVMVNGPSDSHDQHQRPSHSASSASILSGAGARSLSH